MKRRAEDDRLRPFFSFILVSYKLRNKSTPLASFRPVTLGGLSQVLKQKDPGMKTSFALLVLISALFSTPGYSSSYSSLFPKATLPQVSTRPVLTGINEVLESRSSDFNSCLSLLNSSEARKGDGVAHAKSGSILVTFRNAPNQVREIEVVDSAFRYESIESCLIRSLKEAPLPSAYKDLVLASTIKFDLSCKLKKLSGSAWMPHAQVERKCSIAWSSAS